jgi:excisionase family DNA binding protein
MVVKDQEARDRWIPIEPAARYMGVSRSTLRTLMKAGRVPHYRPSRRRVVFDKADLDAYVAAQRAG